MHSNLVFPARKNSLAPIVASYVHGSRAESNVVESLVSAEFCIFDVKLRVLVASEAKSGVWQNGYFV